MIAKVGAYLIVYVVLAVIELPFYPASFYLAKLLRNFKRVSPVAYAIFGTIVVCCGVVLSVWLIGFIDIQPTWLMFLIPGFLLLQNDYMRIKKAKAGDSGAARILMQNDELDAYNQELDLRIEYGRTIGDVAGWIIGVCYFAQPTNLL